MINSLKEHSKSLFSRPRPLGHLLDPLLSHNASISVLLFDLQTVEKTIQVALSFVILKVKHFCGGFFLFFFGFFIFSAFLCLFEFLTVSRDVQAELSRLVGHGTLVFLLEISGCN